MSLAARGVAGEGEAPQVVDTLGRRMHVRWDTGAAATPHGQLVFFAEFLAATGMFARWEASCPLRLQFKALDRWGCLLHCIIDRIAPVVGPPRTLQGLPAAG